jgi:hypothetical protein
MSLRRIAGGSTAGRANATRGRKLALIFVELEVAG